MPAVGRRVNGASIEHARELDSLRGTPDTRRVGAKVVLIALLVALCAGVRTGFATDDAQRARAEAAGQAACVGLLRQHGRDPRVRIGGRARSHGRASGGARLIGEKRTGAAR